VGEPHGLLLGGREVSLELREPGARLTADLITAGRELLLVGLVLGERPAAGERRCREQGRRRCE
jgi:hypothetical protein